MVLKVTTNCEIANKIYKKKLKIWKEEKFYNPRATNLQKKYTLRVILQEFDFFSTCNFRVYKNFRQLFFKNSGVHLRDQRLMKNSLPWEVSSGQMLFLSKISIFDQNFHFRPIFRFLAEILIFRQNLYFS